VKDLKTNSSHIIKSKKVVSAVGPYTGTLLKDLAPYFVDLINPQRVFLAFFKIDDETYNGWDQSQKEKLAESYPVINSSKGTRDGTFFSMIEKWDEKGHPLIKIGGHFQRSKIDKLDEVWQINLTSDEIDWSRKSTLGYFNLLKLPLDSTDLVYMHGYSCVYSLTSTEVPYVTQAMMGENEKDPDFVVLGGMSGVGAKGAMTYGLIGANLLLNIDESGEMFNRVKEDLGFDRMLEDLKAMN